MILQKIKSIKLPFPVILLGVIIATYGLLIPYLKLYMDDWVFYWSWSNLGHSGLTDYFATNRPFWGNLYQLVMPLLPKTPLAYHLYGIFWRWVVSLVFWWLLRIVWPERKNEAAWAALLFAVFPGERMQFISLTLGQMLVVYTTFMLSLILQVLSIRNRKYRVPLFIAAILFSFVNLMSMEYWYTLELIRPVILWVALSQEYPDWKARLKAALIRWLPFLALFCGITIWRTFFFKVQTYNYQLVFLQELKSNPAAAILNLLKIAVVDLWDTTIGSWLPAWSIPFTAAQYNQSVLLILAALVLAVSFLLIILFWGQENQSAPHKLADRTRYYLEMGITGLLALILAGGPFWLTGLPVEPVDFHSRFTLPFMLGSCILLTALVFLIPHHPSRLIFLALTIGLGCGSQFLLANEFRNDAKVNNRYLWQMIWRIPSLEPGTLIFSNDLPVKYYSPATFSMEIESIYTPGSQSSEFAYAVTTPREMIRSNGVDFASDASYKLDLVTRDYTGVLSDSIALQYRTGECLRVLDLRFDPPNLLLEPQMNDVEPYSDTNRILTEPTEFDTNFINLMIGSEPEHDWCYYYEKADLARQMGDWEAAEEYADSAYALNVEAGSPTEHFPFLEAYMRAGNTEKALPIIENLVSEYPYLSESICLITDRIEQANTTDSAAQSTIDAIRSTLDCN